MLKPPASDSVRFYATPRMLRWLLVLLLAVLIPTVGASLAREFLLPHATAPAGAVIAPPMEWTTDGSRYSPPIMVGLPGSLPDPGANQIKDPALCEAPARMRRGGCWVAVADEQPPCDPPPGRPRRLWAEDGRCWLPVATAARLPSSGGSYPVNVADP